MERRLVAILAADVVGYSRLMGEDESGTLTALKAHREEIFDPETARRGGRIVKLMGDGALVEFPSVVDAVECALAIQQSLTRKDGPIRLRIGINLGDIIIEGDDIYGDGVNIAARLEALAEPGGICISSIVHESLGDRISARFTDAGEHSVKNIERPIRVFHWPAVSTAARTIARPALRLPDKPSIAVLPFDNMSGDVEQDYFADGMVEEIITALSRMRWLFVIARNSSFTYKGRAVDVKQVGRDLGVRYVLEGSVRKAGNRVRITGQLVDTAMGAHLWADRFDGALEDVFDLQDQVAASVVGAIAPRLEQAEIERAKRKPTDSLDAYDYYLRGLSLIHQWKREANNEALRLFSKAVEIDPNFASAYGMAARAYSMRKASGWMLDIEAEISEAVRQARRAAELGKGNAVALCTAGIGLAFVGGELEDGGALIKRALDLDPNLAWAWLFNGWVILWLGDPEAGLENFERAMRLSPNDPHVFNMQTAIASAHFFAGRYDQALSWAREAMRAQTHLQIAAGVGAASAALIGDTAEAEKAMAQLRRCAPHLRMSNLERMLPIRRPEHYSAWSEGLQRAGLPK